MSRCLLGGGTFDLSMIELAISKKGGIRKVGRVSKKDLATPTKPSSPWEYFQPVFRKSQCFQYDGRSQKTHEFSDGRQPFCEGAAEAREKFVDLPWLDRDM